MTDDWISPQMQLGINLLTKFWGIGATNVTIVMTKWDLVPKANARRQLEILQGELWKPLLDWGCKMELPDVEEETTLLYKVLERVQKQPVKLTTQQGLGDEGGHATKARQNWQRKLKGMPDERSAALSALWARFWPNENE